MRLNDLSQALANHFSLNFSRAKCLSGMINGAIKARHVHLQRIGEHFDQSHCQPESIRRRIQRFLKDIRISDNLCAEFIASLLPDGPWILAIDRTNWLSGSQTINMLTLAIVFDGIAVPLFVK